MGNRPRGRVPTQQPAPGARLCAGRVRRWAASLRLGRQTQKADTVKYTIK